MTIPEIVLVILTPFPLWHVHVFVDTQSSKSRNKENHFHDTLSLARTLVFAETVARHRHFRSPIAAVKDTLPCSPGLIRNRLAHPHKLSPRSNICATRTFSTASASLAKHSKTHAHGGEMKDESSAGTQWHALVRGQMKLHIKGHFEVVVNMFVREPCCGSVVLSGLLQKLKPQVPFPYHILCCVPRHTRAMRSMRACFWRGDAREIC